MSFLSSFQSQKIEGMLQSIDQTYDQVFFISLDHKPTAADLSYAAEGGLSRSFLGL